MVLDHEVCGVVGCTVHTGLAKKARSVDDRDRQIQEDWLSGEWSVEELSCFWGLMPRSISSIILREADAARAGTPTFEVSHSR